jgi:hypothetical protein
MHGVSPDASELASAEYDDAWMSVSIERTSP